MPGVIYTSVVDKVRNVLEFINELELLAIDKELFPKNQRFIPRSWKSVRSELNKIDGLYVDLNRAKKLADDNFIHREEFFDWLDHMQLLGDIIWPKKISLLNNTLFHKPMELVQKIRFLFRYNLEQFLNFKSENIWSAKGLYTQETMIASMNAVSSVKFVKIFLRLFFPDIIRWSVLMASYTMLLFS